jgi:hypothetical protein
LFGLSGRELDVLAELFKRDLDIPDHEGKNIIDTTSRKIIMSITLVNKHNLSRYISRYKEKNIIIYKQGGWVIHPMLLTSLKDLNNVSITFVLEKENINT